jgi:hypothetical protein
MPEEVAIEKQVEEITVKVQSIVISTPDEYKSAGEFLIGVRALGKRILEKWKNVTDPIKVSLKKAEAERDKELFQIKQVDEQVTKMLGAYNAEVERIEREKAAAKAREEAAERQRLADIEAARVRAENEAKRVKAEEAAKKLREEGDKKAAAAALEKAKLDDERRQKKAEADAQAERERLARQADEDAKKAAANAVIPDSPKVDGISKGRTIWKFRITDPDKIPHAYCIPDETAIGGVVRAMQNKAKAEKAIPGIEVWSEQSKVGVKV